MRLADTIACLLLALSTSLIYGCSPCGDEEVVEQVSPSGARSAIVSIRDCGAIASSRTRVIVRPPHKRASGIVVFVARKEQRIELLWNKPSELLVRCFTCLEENVEFEVAKVDQFKISYELLGTKMPNLEEFSKPGT